MTIRIVPYISRESTDKKFFTIQALNPAGAVVGHLDYEDCPDALRLGLIQVDNHYQGTGYSRAMMDKLLEVAGQRPILIRQVNWTAAGMLQHGQKTGRITISEPPGGLAFWQIQAVR